MGNITMRKLLLLKVNFQFREALQQKHLISAALRLQSREQSLMNTHHVTYARGVVYL